MFNSLIANRRLALRMVAFQALVATAVAAAFLLQDPRSAVSAAMGGGAVTMGSLALAWRSMFGPAYSGGLALARLLGGLLLKWFVILGVVYIALVRFGLPPLPLFVGLVLAMAASFLTQGSTMKGVQ